MIRLGDTRFGGKGTRVQTFVESDFRWRFYVDPVGTSRFAAVKPDLQWSIVAGEPHRLEIVSPRLVGVGVPFKVHVHAEDIWGNVTKDLKEMNVSLRVRHADQRVFEASEEVPLTGWSNVVFRDMTLADQGSYMIEAELRDASGTVLLTAKVPITASTSSIVPKILFGDLHVHSDDTVGTEDSAYNFSYGRDIAGLDVLGYTANDFQITKEKWEATVALIVSLNKPGSFVLFPGTEWCGNSAAGGDHNIVFLADPVAQPPEFPFDRHGNVARSFEWSENGPADLQPGAWPLDEVYATYAHDSENHLLIPHVGGRRCNLAWHHPRLERLLEIGSAWGQFEWLLQDAVRRGWKLGVSANSDEHRGRCGGGVPGTAVFGTRGGLTGILADTLDRQTVASALRSRHTFATTGTRLVGIVTADDGRLQGDEVDVVDSVRLQYHFLGNVGFSSIEAFDATGRVWHRDLWEESESERKVLRVSWGGARLYDRYREAVWHGRIVFDGESRMKAIQPFGGIEYNPEDTVSKAIDHSIQFDSRTSGDTDGVHATFVQSVPDAVTIWGTIGGYVKVGDALAGNQHKPQPTFALSASREELIRPGGKRVDIKGGAGLFVSAELVPDIELPIELKGEVAFHGTAGDQRDIYFVAREWSGHKVVSSPVFITYK